MSVEPKKLAILRIMQILEQNTDKEHPLKQTEIAEKLEKEYGIVLERKAIGKNIQLLKDSDIEIESTPFGCYLSGRKFEDSELRLLIDGVLASNYISERQSKDLIEKICSLSNNYFRSNHQYIHSVGEWNNSSDSGLFYNIELIDDAISKGVRIKFEYNKYKVDKKLQKSSEPTVSAYQLILKNQRYYLMALNEKYGNITNYRVDRIRNIKLLDEKITPLRSVDGYEDGINYKALSTQYPYMFSDKPERVVFETQESMVDQIIDWFGKDITITKSKNDENSIEVSLLCSPMAMQYWALQYLDRVEIKSPATLREKIYKTLKENTEKYSG